MDSQTLSPQKKQNFTAGIPADVQVPFIDDRIPHAISPLARPSVALQKNRNTDAVMAAHDVHVGDAFCAGGNGAGGQHA